MAALLGKLFPAFARPASRREELTELLQESVGDKASFDSHEGALLQNFLSLRDLTAVDVMIPRADIFAVSLNDGFVRANGIFNFSHPFANHYNNIFNSCFKN